MRWHWFSAKRAPQAPPMWLGQSNDSRAVIDYYGIETANAFFGLLRFRPKGGCGICGTPLTSENNCGGDCSVCVKKIELDLSVARAPTMTMLELVKLHRVMFDSGLKEAVDAVKLGWLGEVDWKPR